MAPARQAVTQGASSQWRHCIAKETGLLTSRRILLMGLGRSLLYALMVSFVFECATVQATSQSPQPMHACWFATIFFIGGYLTFYRGLISMLMCSSTSLVQRTPLLVVVWLPFFTTILQVFRGMLFTSYLVLTPQNGMYSIYPCRKSFICKFRNYTIYMKHLPEE